MPIITINCPSCSFKLVGEYDELLPSSIYCTRCRKSFRVEWGREESRRWESVSEEVEETVVDSKEEE